MGEGESPQHHTFRERPPPDALMPTLLWLRRSSHAMPFHSCSSKPLQPSNQDDTPPRPCLLLVSTSKAPAVIAWSQTPKAFRASSADVRLRPSGSQQHSNSNPPPARDPRWSQGHDRVLSCYCYCPYSWNSRGWNGDSRRWLDTVPGTSMELGLASLST